MGKLLRFLSGIIITISGIHLAIPLIITSKNSPTLLCNKFIGKIIIALLIIKGICEIIRYISKKGTVSLENIFLRKFPILGVLILFPCIFLALISLYAIVSGNLQEFSIMQLFTLTGVFLFCFLLIHDNAEITGGNKLAIKKMPPPNLGNSGENGEKMVLTELTHLCAGNNTYKFYNNTIIKFQEFDFIVIGENGIFNLEVKNIANDNTILVIDEDGNWTKIRNEQIIGVMDNPIAQVGRHHDVLKNILGKKYPIIDAVVIANENILVQGTKNSPVNVVKLKSLTHFIKNYNCEKRLSAEEITDICDTINQNTQQERNQTKVSK